jgi:2-iminobutanoate/2-iminopropanoate deaminase
MTMSAKLPISSPDAPEAVGPYSQAVRSGDFIFTAGQIPLEPATGEICATSVTDQTERVLANLQAVLGAAGSGLGDVVKTTVFLTDLSTFAEMNAVYSKYFHEPFPARSTIQVAALPKGARVEIEAVARIPSSP